MHRQYKNLGKDAESLRKNRVQQVVMLRKEKRDDVMAKKRNIVESEDLSLVDHEAVIQNDYPQNLVLQAKSEDPEIRLKAVVDIRKLLSSSRNPPIDDLISAGVLPVLISCLDYSNVQLQLEATWALTNIASGTSEQTLAVVSAGAVPLFIDLLKSSSSEVSEQAVWALGNIIGDGHELRDYCLELGVLPSLLEFISPGTPVEFLRNVTWVLVNICRSRNPQISKSVIRTLLPALSALIHHQDLNIAVDSIWALTYLTDAGDEQIQMVIDSGVVPFLVPHLASTSSKFLKASVRALGNIVTGSDKQTQLVIDSGALQYLPSLLSHADQKIHKEAVWFVSNITAGTINQIDAVYEAQIFPIVINLLSSGDFPTRQEAAWAVANASLGGNLKHIQHMVSLNVIAPLCALLSVQNSQTVQVVLDCLLKILNKSAPDNDTVCRMIEECEGLEQIERLQHHGNEEIYKMAYNIIDTYFSAEEEDITVNATQDSLFQAGQQNVPEEGFHF